VRGEPEPSLASIQGLVWMAVLVTGRLSTAVFVVTRYIELNGCTVYSGLDWYAGRSEGETNFTDTIGQLEAVSDAG
jgi:hypothetical protein